MLTEFGTDLFLDSSRSLANAHALVHAHGVESRPLGPPSSLLKEASKSDPSCSPSEASYTVFFPLLPLCSGLPGLGSRGLAFQKEPSACPEWP